MSTVSILKNINKHITLSRSEADYFTSLLFQKTVLKNSLILYEGEPCNYINYIIRGAFRSYSFDRNGNEISIMFAIDDWWITDMHGFIFKKPSMVNIAAIEDSVIFQLHHDDLEKLYEKVPAFEKFFRILMQNSYIREQVRMKQNLTAQAEERYDNFTKKYPHFIKRIPLKYIASYLGVTPQFLSVIRGRK